MYVHNCLGNIYFKTLFFTKFKREILLQNSGKSVPEQQMQKTYCMNLIKPFDFSGPSYCSEGEGYQKGMHVNIPSGL